MKPRKLTENQLYTDYDQVLVSRSDIDLRNAQLEKMKSKYEELAMQNEYQVKIKEMNHSEKLKEAKDTLAHQIDQWKSKHETVDREKSDLEVQFNAR
jgi:hypothetical protein